MEQEAVLIGLTRFVDIARHIPDGGRVSRNEMEVVVGNHPVGTEPRTAHPHRKLPPVSESECGVVAGCAADIEVPGENGIEKEKPAERDPFLHGRVVGRIDYGGKRFESEFSAKIGGGPDWIRIIIVVISATEPEKECGQDHE